ncbi:MAG: hypothetical protein EZS28_037433, partial [Streblomastix strix]
IPKKKGGCSKILDCLILNSELETEYFKLEGITDIQEIIMPNDWATTIDLHQAFHHIRHQRNAVWSFYGPENLYQMPPTSNSRSQEAMQFANLRLRRRYSDPELGSHSFTTRNIADNEDPRRVWPDDRYGQEPYQSHAASRVPGLAVEHENNDNANDNIPKERCVETIRTSDGTSQEKETRKNIGLGVGNWRDPIYKSTIQTRRASYQVVLKDERQGSSQQRLEQVDSTQQERDNRHNLVEQQVSPQPTIMLHETQQVDNHPDRCFELRLGGITNLREQGKGVRTRMTAVLKALLEFRQEFIQQQPIGIQLLIDNTITMYCLNKGKGSITIATLVDKVLNLGEQYNWIIVASHIPGLSNTIPDSLSRLSRCGDYAIKREVLQKTLRELGIQIFIDIFATRANRQSTRYCSISKYKFAIKRNGFKLEWSEEVPLLHPPISQLLKTIRKVKKE